MDEQHPALSNRKPTPPSEYKGIWKRYVKYINEARNNGELPEGDKYLTRVNVDMYFSNVVTTLEVTPQSAKRHRSALQWYSNNDEFFLEEEPFQVANGQVVEASLEQQAQTFATNYLLRNHDAHENLPTDVLSKEDHRKLLHHIFSSNVQNWQDLAFGWTCTHDTFLRLASLKIMRLCDIKTNLSHVPNENGPNNRMITLILQPMQHKHNGPNSEGGKKARTKRRGGQRTVVKTKKRVVGMWRHKDYYRCATGLLAKVFFSRYHCDETLNFNAARNDTERPDWQEKPLITWKSLSNARDAYNNIYAACNIHWAKVTHMRTAGMEYASSQGEHGADQLATLSKHRAERIFEAYLTELFPPLLKTMAGFSPSDNYFLPRSEVPLPYKDDEVVHLVFPRYKKWVAGTLAHWPSMPPLPSCLHGSGKGGEGMQKQRIPPRTCRENRSYGWSKDHP